MEAAGRYFDGQFARARDIRVRLQPPFLVLLQDGTAIDQWPLAELRDESATPSAETMTLSRRADDAARLVVEDGAFIRSLRTVAANLHKRRAGAKGWWRPVVLLIAAASAGVLLFFIYGIPMIASGVAALVPLQMRQDLGANAAEYMSRALSGKATQSEAICQNAAGQAALDGLVDRLRRAGSGDIPPLTVRVIRGKTANAFALPGGHIIILSPLFELAEEPNALAGVLAHEIGHVEALHPTTNMLANAGMAVMLSVIFGDVSGGTVLAAVGQQALGASYSRDFERRADESAVRYMSHWGYDIAPLGQLLRDISKKAESDNVYARLFASHPHSGERQQMLAAVGSTGNNSALNATEWAAVRGMCGSGT
jgi:Zn-dependent protease with chaperone function